MIDTGMAVVLNIEGEKELYYIPATDLPALERITGGEVPEGWRPLNTTTDQEATILAPRETVTAQAEQRSCLISTASGKSTNRPISVVAATTLFQSHTAISWWRGSIQSSIGSKAVL
jgi:hypothetical protein